MDIIWGILIIVFGLIAWIGQVLSAMAPTLAAKLQLSEPKEDVDPAFYADARGEAKWDMLTGWTLPLAGILILFNNPLWIFFGMIGGSIYLYFGGRAIFTRLELQKNGIRIGKQDLLKMYYIFAALWAFIGLATILKAINAILNDERLNIDN